MSIENFSIKMLKSIKSLKKSLGLFFKCFQFLSTLVDSKVLNLNNTIFFFKSIKLNKRKVLIDFFDLNILILFSIIYKRRKNDLLIKQINLPFA